MAKEDAIRVAGTVIETRPDGTFWVALANGHRLLAHLLRRQRQAAGRIAVGDRVDLELTPFDLSKGRILLSETKENEL
ncbi:MAG: translation initiation factor IF-1 [Pedosphaera parvula]|nr:translation initiation factor IF-1 [Pedosphaera parvula]